MFIFSLSFRIGELALIMQFFTLALGSIQGVVLFQAAGSTVGANLPSILSTIVNFVFQIAGPLFVLELVAGFIMLSMGGFHKSTGTKGGQILIYALLGTGGLLLLPVIGGVFSSIIGAMGGGSLTTTMPTGK